MTLSMKRTIEEFLLTDHIASENEKKKSRFYCPVQNMCEFV